MKLAKFRKTNAATTHLVIVQVQKVQIGKSFKVADFLNALVGQVELGARLFVFRIVHGKQTVRPRLDRPGAAAERARHVSSGGRRAAGCQSGLVSGPRV